MSKKGDGEGKKERMIEGERENTFSLNFFSSALSSLKYIDLIGNFTTT